MRYQIIVAVFFMSCSDDPTSPQEYILTIDNDLPVQVKFYVNSKIKLRIDGESVEDLTLTENEYTFGISSDSFLDCTSFSCTTVFSTNYWYDDTTLHFGKDMVAEIRINIIDQLSDADIYHVEFKIK